MDQRSIVDVVIRDAAGRDAPIILGLLYDLGRPRPEKDSDVDVFRGMVKEYVADPDKRILVAVRREIEIVGMASMMFLPRLNRVSPEAYIPELIVSKRHRSLGVGRKLVDFCIALADEKKCHRIRLESANRRGGSHKFYERLGFDQSALSFTRNS